jgi:hypothetical protein
MIYLLPYIEQNSLYDKLIKGGGTGYGNSANGPLYTGVKIGIYRCPSTPLPPTTTSGVPGSGVLMLPTVVAIAGAEPDSFIVPPATIPLFNETRWGQGTGSPGCCSGGRLSRGGVLSPNGLHGFEHIIDGSSNTAVVSEQADFMVTLNQSKQPWNAAGPHGWTIGWGNQNNNFTLGVNLGDARAFNTTTIRYRINLKKGVSNLGWPDAPGDCATYGVCDNTGMNIPLNSTHPGGVLVLFGDGSVRFVTETVPIHVLASMATRDDGLPLGDALQ